MEYHSFGLKRLQVALLASLKLVAVGDFSVELSKIEIFLFPVEFEHCEVIEVEKRENFLFDHVLHLVPLVDLLNQEILNGLQEALVNRLQQPSQLFELLGLLLLVLNQQTFRFSR